MIEIICYAGGTCGDLIAALIDSKGAYFRNKAVMFKQERLRFKKPHAFADDEERDQYLAEMTLKYKSIPSHDLQYHLRRKHNFIGITVSDWNTAQWASKRFKELHQSHVWEDMIAASGADFYTVAKRYLDVFTFVLSAFKAKSMPIVVRVSA